MPIQAGGKRQSWSRDAARADSCEASSAFRERGAAMRINCHGRQSFGLGFAFGKEVGVIRFFFWSFVFWPKESPFEKVVRGFQKGEVEP